MLRGIGSLVLLLLLPALASADAIMMFEGDCFPGSRRGIRNHRSACIPIACEDDAACGEGATCQTLCVCRAEREFTSNGRVLYPEPVTRVVEVSLCDADGACAEGDVAERRQCEPIADTPAFDRRAHRWTGEPHPAGAVEAESEGQVEAESEGQAEAQTASPRESAPQGGSCAGCAVPVAGERTPWPWVAMAWLALRAGRSARRRRGR